jgi:histidine triad (HIT) family protein
MNAGKKEGFMAYDTNNIFAKILRGEIPCKKVYEDSNVLAFNDIAPKAPVHILVLPKGAYTDMDDFTNNASAGEIAALFKALGTIAREQNLEKTGYRVISNCGLNGGQEVPHLHLHLLGGKRLGRMID